MSDAYALWLLIKDVYDFEMDTFDGRLKLQKTVYLLQAFGVNMGYHFNWYKRGPYSPDLTRDGFEVSKDKKHMAYMPVKFRDDDTLAKYDNFKKFIADQKDNADSLEIAASLCYRRNEDGMSTDMALDLTENKMERFNREDCRRIWMELQNLGVVKE